MKNIGINKPCSENWNEMSKNEKGAFCQKCASQVHDFTKKSSSEIKQTLLELIGQPVCGRITNKQEIELNDDFNHWINQQNKRSFQSQLLFALLIVFGLGLFSCENPQDEVNLKQIQTTIARIIEEEKIEPLKTESIVIDENQIITAPEINYIQGDIAFEGYTDFPIVEPVIPEEPKECIKMGEMEISMVGAMEITERYRTYIMREDIQIETDIDENGSRIAKKFEAKVFPNPAKEETTFEIRIPEKGFYEISLFDMSGKILQEIRNGELNKGKFRQELNLIDLVPGMYMILINSGNFKETVRFSKI